MVFSRSQLTDEERAKAEHRSKIANRILDTLLFIPALAAAVKFAVAFVTAGVGIVRLFLFGAWALFLLVMIIKGRKSGTVGFVLMLICGIFVILMMFIISGMPGSFSSHLPAKFKAQVKYVESLHNGHSDCFPDKLPDDIEDYSIDYMPSIMQGTGHFRVRFRTSAEQIEKYEKEYSEKAIYTIPLKDFGGKSIINVQEFSPEAEVSYEDDKSLDVAYSQTFWEGHENGATVYVASAVHNWNHPHSGAVIINRSECMIEFTQLG